MIAGATCTVTETSDGSSSTVNVTTTITGSPVTIAADGTGTVDVTDTYTFVPGSLTVTKTIAGPSAGEQGPVTIHVDCGADVLVTDVTIPAGATSPDPATFDDIPAGTVCTVTETADGSTSTVAVTTTGSPQDVTIPAGDAAAAEITDTYAPAPGSLTVTKTIAGPAAGSQAAVTIHAVCDGTALTPDFVIHAGTAAGTTSHTYDDVPAGATCTVTETVDGSSSTVACHHRGQPAGCDRPGRRRRHRRAGRHLHLVPGSLTVTKTISGVSAGQQGAITIGVNCGGLPLPEFTIPAGATGPQSHTYDNIPAGLTCTVTEEADGSTSTIGVVTTGSPQDVTIGANAEASAELTDTYGPVPGSLEVRKTINGPSAGSQGEITIAVTCGTTTLPTWTIPAGTGATDTDAHLPGHSGRVLVHRHRDIERGHHHGHRHRRRREPNRHGARRHSRLAQHHRHVLPGARRRGDSEDARRPGRRESGACRHPADLPRADPGLRVGDPRRSPGRSGVAGLQRRRWRFDLPGGRGHRRAHGHGGGRGDRRKPAGNGPRGGYRERADD